jgi:hypothetical protein
VSFEEEVLLARVRARGSRLLLPTLLLCVAAFLSTFLSSHFDQQWQLTALYSVCGAVAVLGFVVPLVRYLTAWTDITTAQIITRAGIFGQRYRAVALANVDRIELETSRTITVHVNGEEPLLLVGLPKAKLIAQELISLNTSQHAYLQGAK